MHYFYYLKLKTIYNISLPFTVLKEVGRKSRIAFVTSFCVYVLMYVCVCRDFVVGISSRSADQIPVTARFPALVHTGNGAQIASCKMGTASLSAG